MFLFSFLVAGIKSKVYLRPFRLHYVDEFLKLKLGKSKFCKGQEFTDIFPSGMSFSFPNISVASSGTFGNCPVGPEIILEHKKYCLLPFHCNRCQRFVYFLFELQLRVCIKGLTVVLNR